MRYLTAGESHGRAMVGILEEFPAGVRIGKADVARSLARRRRAPGRGLRQNLETDFFLILGGLCRGVTTGAPIAVLVDNVGRKTTRDDSSVPRPGHADFAGMIKNTA